MDLCFGLGMVGQFGNGYMFVWALSACQVRSPFFREPFGFRLALACDRFGVGVRQCGFDLVTMSVQLRGSLVRTWMNLR